MSSLIASVPFDLVMDTIAVIYRRLRAGHSPFKPDRGHIHHILMDAGLGARSALVFLIAVAGSIAFLGAMAGMFGETVSLQAFALLLAVYVFGINRIWWRQRVRRARLVSHTAANDPDLGVGNHARLARARTIEPSQYPSTLDSD